MVNVSNCRELWIARKTSTSSTRMDKPLIKKTGWGTTDREKDRWTKRMRRREGGCRAL